MNGSTSTTVTQTPPSPEETAYLDSQQALAAKQLDILNSQSGFDQSYLDQIKPILDQQTQLLGQSITSQSDYLKSIQPSIDAQTKLLQQQLDQATAAANDPVQQQIAKSQNDLIASQLADQQDLEPLQKQLLQAQLSQAINGNNATPEQSALIDQATADAQASGESDISSFSNDALTQLRQNLSPTLGLRPTDTPITDRGQLVEKEAVRQQGQLTSNLDQANANAKLNYPLAAGQLSQALSTSSGQLSLATQDFQNQLAQAAATNRLQLIGAGNQSLGIGLTGGGLPGGSSALDAALNSGTALASASRENPLSFSQGSTTSQSSSPGFVQILGALGGAASGLGALGLSDARSKSDVETIDYDDAGHRWVSFRYKDEPKSVRHIGVIAQEAEKIDPGAVLTDGNGVKFVNYNRLSRAA